jgi:molybdopterin/thiamine biosynthesis adenylyltransferase
MFQKLVNRNDDLRRLVEKGYAVAFDEGYLVIRDIPYLGAQRELLIGTIVAKLVMVDKEQVRQDNHQVYFAGASPYGLDGRPIPNMADRPAKIPLGSRFADVVVERSFSNKPRKTGKFADFFEKIESYVSIISGPAIERHGATPYTFRTREDPPAESVFKFHDTMTSRAEIGDLSARLKDDVLAVIGLGGTGAYLLDLLVKIPAREIRIFDLDPFHVHNAFRSPGKLGEEELNKPKAEVYASRYENFRSGITANVRFVDTSCESELDGVTFAFVCVDKGSSRAGIFDLLLAKGIPFIDVGMGLNRKHGPLGGMLRVTYYSPERGAALRKMKLAELNDTPDDLYRTNIQIAELNAMNACLAVVRFKQIRGFYNEELASEHLLMNVGDLSVAGEAAMGDESSTEEG